MNTLNEGINPIDEVAYFFAVGYLRLRGISKRCGEPMLVEKQISAPQETSLNSLDIPEMSSNL
jgi:hypothetical protein